MIALLQISWLKIGQYLTKLCVDYVGLLFWPTLYNATADGAPPRTPLELTALPKLAPG